MAKISNDHDLREALNALSAIRQRILGAKFAENVIHLSKDDRVNRAATTARNPDAGDTELQDAYKAAEPGRSRFAFGFRSGFGFGVGQRIADTRAESFQQRRSQQTMPDRRRLNSDDLVQQVGLGQLDSAVKPRRNPSRSVV